MEVLEHPGANNSLERCEEALRDCVEALTIEGEGACGDDRMDVRLEVQEVSGHLLGQRRILDESVPVPGAPSHRAGTRRPRDASGPRSSGNIGFVGAPTT